MVSLPPARKGGRKGPLSVAELKKRREARKQGVCIRCRQLKEKCHGGFPCIPCRENSKAVLWKFPCTKAQFLDLLERGSYFQDVEAFQTYAVEIMDENSVLQVFRTALTMVSLGHSSSELTAGFSGWMQGPVDLCWHRGLQVVMDICKQALTNKSYVTGHQLIETPYILTQSKLSPPIIIDERDLSATTKERMSILILFCTAQYAIPDSIKNVELPPDAAQALETTAKLFVWISRRYYEVILFRSLQDAVNRLKSLATGELSEIAGVLLDVLFIGSVQLCKTEDAFLYQNNDSSIEREKAYLDQRLRIRKALFIYFSITLDKLPAWCDFWQMAGNDSKEAAPALSKHHLTDLETFDQYCQREIMRAKIYSAGEAAFEGTPDMRDEGQHNTNAASIDRKVRLDNLNKIFKGPRSAEADIEAIAKRLSDIYQPKLESIERLFTMLEESVSDPVLSLSSSPISQAVRSLVLVGRDIRQKVERHLGNQLKSRKRKEVCSDIDGLVNETLDYMKVVEEIDRIVWTLVGRVQKMVDDMSM